MPDLEMIVTPDGVTRKFGNLAPDPARLKAYPVFGETPTTPLVPRSEWKGRIDAAGGPGPDSPYLGYVSDQGSVGQCNANATVSAAEAQRAKQGLPNVRLSPADLYARINGGRDQGSLLEDGLRAMLTAGVGTAATSGERWEQGSYLGPASAADRAANRLLEAYLCPTFDAVMSAWLQGFDLVSGVWWYDNYTPGPDGWLPPGRGNRGGHAVHGYKATYRMPSAGGIEYGGWHKNSWRKTWGLGGRCVFAEGMYAQGGIGGWWACRAMTDEGGVVPAEQAA